MNVSRAAPSASGPVPKALITAARRASTANEPLERRAAAKAIVRLPDPSVTDFGPARAAIARAIRSNVVALALVTDTAARRVLAACTQELCNALLSEPGPAEPRPWWADL
ncbi:MAG: hypothetical protein RL274_2796 [Pseudomonadota bacterium]